MSSPTALEQTATLARSVAQLAALQWEDQAWDEVDPSALLNVAAELAASRNVLDAALCRVAERIEATDAALDLGWASTKDFLTRATGGHKGAGGGILGVASLTRDLLQVRDRFQAGEISMTQARVIGSRVNTLPRDPELRSTAAQKMLDLVDTYGHDATDLDRSFAGVVHEIDPDGTLLKTDLDKERQERGAHHARELTFSPDSLGGVRVRGYGSIEDAELIKACLMPLAAPRPTAPGACGGDPSALGRYDDAGRPLDPGCPTPGCGHTGRDPRETPTRMWDALLEACHRLQQTDTLPHAHGASARITVTLTLDDLRAAASSDHTIGQGRLPSGETLSAAAVRRLACDNDIIPAVLGGQGQILDLGRTQRLVSTALFHALVLRDQHCTFPGCDRLPLACDAHHIIHWADGGPTRLDNLVLLCRRHHTLTHHTPWSVHIDPTTHHPTWTPPPRPDHSPWIAYHPGGPPPRPPLAA